MNIVIALIISGIVAYCVVKRYKPQTILAASGVAMMLIGYFAGYKTTGFVPAKYATGFVLFDMFEFIQRTMISDVAGLGLMIMTCTGFAKYMDYIGASSRMVELSMKPLAMLRAPYVVLAGSFIVCNAMALVITSVSALAILMMVTIFPVLIRIGVSRIAAASVIVSGHIMDIGPGSPTTLFVAKTANVPINKFFVEHQLPVYIIVSIVGALTHYFWQKRMDKKESLVTESASAGADLSKGVESDLNPPGPNIYAILPVMPLVMLLGFSEYGYQGIKMNVNLAMLLSLTVAMIFELIRNKNVKIWAESIQGFLRGMGDSFVNVVSLITAAQTFAYGLTCMNVIDSTISLIKSADIGLLFITVLLSVFLFFISMLMGSGVAATFAFAPLVPAFAKAVGGSPATILQAMQNSASLGRLVSPITGAMIAAAGMGGVSVVDLVKRNTVPIVVCALTQLIAILIIFN